jgi:hypothetical protein
MVPPPESPYLSDSARGEPLVPLSSQAEARGIIYPDDDRVGTYTVGRRTFDALARTARRLNVSGAYFEYLEPDAIELSGRSGTSALDLRDYDAYQSLAWYPAAGAILIGEVGVVVGEEEVFAIAGGSRRFIDDLASELGRTWDQQMADFRAWTAQNGYSEFDKSRLYEVLQHVGTG